MHANVDVLTRDGLAEFVDYCKSYPRMARSEMPGMTPGGFTAIIEYATCKYWALDPDMSEDDVLRYNHLAEEAFERVPFKKRWRLSREDLKYTHLRNLDAFDNERLLALRNQSAHELWDGFFPHYYGKGRVPKLMTTFRNSIDSLLIFRGVNHIKDNPFSREQHGTAFEAFHYNLFPWAQWRQNHGNYSCIKGRALTERELYKYPTVLHQKSFNGGSYQ